jgi:hypothetical protein
MPAKGMSTTALAELGKISNTGIKEMSKVTTGRYETEQKYYKDRLGHLASIQNKYIDEASEILNVFDRPFFRATIPRYKGNKLRGNFSFDLSILNMTYLLSSLAHSINMVAKTGFENKDIWQQLIWWSSNTYTTQNNLFQEIYRSEFINPQAGVYARLPPGGWFGDVPFGYKPEGPQDANMGILGTASGLGAMNPLGMLQGTFDMAESLQGDSGSSSFLRDLYLRAIGQK